MRHPITILLSVLFLSCFNSLPVNKKSLQSNLMGSSLSLGKERNSYEKVKLFKDAISVKEITEPETTDTSNLRINIEKVLSEKHNYRVRLISDSILVLCCYDILDITKSINYRQFKTKQEIHYLEKKEEIIEVFYFKNSFIKKYFNDHPRVMHTDLVYGIIKDKNLIEDERFMIGMSKIDLLQFIFFPSKIFKAIKEFKVYEDDIGEAYTSYRFVKDTLNSIVFDSDYDWIDKGFK